MHGTKAAGRKKLTCRAQCRRTLHARNPLHVASASWPAPSPRSSQARPGQRKPTRASNNHTTLQVDCTSSGKCPHRPLAFSLPPKSTWSSSLVTPGRRPRRAESPSTPEPAGQQNKHVGPRATNTRAKAAHQPAATGPQRSQRSDGKSQQCPETLFKWHARSHTLDATRGCTFTQPFRPEVASCGHTISATLTLPSCFTTCTKDGGGSTRHGASDTGSIPHHNVICVEQLKSPQIPLRRFAFPFNALDEVRKRHQQKGNNRPRKLSGSPTTTPRELNGCEFAMRDATTGAASPCARPEDKWRPY